MLLNLPTLLDSFNFSAGATRTVTFQEGAVPDTNLIKRLMFDIRYDIAATSATVISQATQAGREALFDAIMSQVQLITTGKGTLVNNLALSELFRLGMEEGIRPSYDLAPGYSATFAVNGTNAHTGRLIVSIPFESVLLGIGDVFCPYYRDLLGGKLQYTCGSGAYTDGAANAFTVGTTTTIQVYADHAPAKADGARAVRSFDKVSLATTGQSLGTGLFVTAHVKLPSTNNTPFLADLNISNPGWQLSVDGKILIPQTAGSPLRYVGLFDGRWYGPDAYEIDSVAVAGSQSRLKALGLPLISTGPLDRLENMIHARRGVIVEWNTTAYTGAQTVLVSRVAYEAKCACPDGVPNKPTGDLAPFLPVYFA